MNPYRKTVETTLTVRNLVCIRVLVILPCITLASASAQTWTPISRNGQAAYLVGPIGSHSGSTNYTALVETHDQFSLSEPGGTVPDTSISYQVDAVPSPTGMSMSIAGTADRGDIPCPFPTCTGSAWANSTVGDYWSFTLAQSTCFTLTASINVFDSSGNTAIQGYQFGGSGGMQLSNGQNTTFLGANLNATGSGTYYYSGILLPGNYSVGLTGEAAGGGAPMTSSFSHSITITLGAPRNGDGDGSGAADGRDIAGFIAAFLHSASSGTAPCAYDMNGDGVVNEADIVLFANRLLGF